MLSSPLRMHVNSRSSSLVMHKSSLSAGGATRRRRATQHEDGRWSNDEFPTNFCAVVADKPPQPPPCLTSPVGGNLPITHCRSITPARVCVPLLFIVICSDLINVVYREPVNGPRSPPIVHRQSLWLADMWQAYWAAGSEPSRRKQSKWRRRSSD